MTIFADADIEQLVLASRTATPVHDVATLRQGSQERAATRPAGPPMPAGDRLIGEVPVRVYDQHSKSRMVYVHGGGFVLGDLDTHDAFCRRLAAATGTTVVAVDYRRAPEHPFPAAVDDTQTVVDWAAAQGPVALAGDSAGAFIVVQAALRTKAALTAQLLVCPLIDIGLDQPSAAEKGTGFVLDVPELREWISWWAPDPAAVPNPLLADPSDLSRMPPALVVTVEHDPLRDGGNRYAELLSAAGVPVIHRVEPGLVHNFPTLTHLSAAATAADARFLADARSLLAR